MASCIDCGQPVGRERAMALAEAGADCQCAACADASAAPSRWRRRVRSQDGPRDGDHPGPARIRRRRRGPPPSQAGLQPRALTPRGCVSLPGHVAVHTRRPNPPARRGGGEAASEGTTAMTTPAGRSRLWDAKIAARLVQVANEVGLKTDSAGMLVTLCSAGRAAPSTSASRTRRSTSPRMAGAPGRRAFAGASSATTSLPRWSRRSGSSSMRPPTPSQRPMR